MLLHEDGEGENIVKLIWLEVLFEELGFFLFKRFIFFKIIYF